MPSQGGARDAAPIVPVFVAVLILGSFAAGISSLMPPGIPSPTMLAQAAAASGEMTLDQLCTPDNDYSCDFPGKDQQGRLCGKGMPVETTQVKGHCVSLNKAQADCADNMAGSCLSPQRAPGAFVTQTGNAQPGVSYYGSFYPITTDQPLQPLLPSNQTSNLDTFGAPTYGGLQSGNSIYASQPSANGQTFDGSQLPAVPLVPSSQPLYNAPVFDETTGLWEGPGTLKGTYFNGPTSEGSAAPLVDGQVAPPPPGTIIDDQGNVVSVPSNSQAYQLPMSEYPTPPSMDNVFNGTPNAGPIPPEYQPRPDEGGTGVAQETPQANTTQNLYVYGAQTTLGTQSNYSSSYEYSNPGDSAAGPTDNQGFFGSTVQSIKNYFGNLFSKL